MIVLAVIGLAIAIPLFVMFLLLALGEDPFQPALRQRNWDAYDRRQREYRRREREVRQHWERKRREQEEK